MAARYAIYYAPAQSTRLWRAASAWLGWDAYSGFLLPPPQISGLPRGELLAMTEAPRRYGFHATLKAPFELAASASEQSLLQVMGAFCRQQAPFSVNIKLGQLKDFLALVPVRASPPLDRLAAACVEAFEPFRAPLSEFDRARYGRGKLTPRQREMLDRWGYPHVMEDFRFHLSLTGSLDEISLERARRAILRFFAGAQDAPLEVDALCLFKQNERGERFRVLERFPLTAVAG